MIGLVAVICILNDVRYEYMSYSILLLNAFARPVNWAFRPRVWGEELKFVKRLSQAASITAGVLAATFAVIYLHHLNAIQYVLFAYIVFCVIRFVVVNMKKKTEKVQAA